MTWWHKMAIAILFPKFNCWTKTKTWTKRFQKIVSNVCASSAALMTEPQIVVDGVACTASNISQ